MKGIEKIVAYGSDVWPLLVASFLGHIGPVQNWLHDHFFASNEGNDATRIHDIAICCLQLSAKKGHIDLTRVLLDAGVNVNAQNLGQWETPILIAAQEGDLDMLQLILRPPYQLRKHGDDYESAVFSAAGQQDAEKATKMVGILYASADQPLQQPDNRSEVFLIACRLGNLRLAKMMFDDGPIDLFTVNHSIAGSVTAIDAAAEGRHLDCVQFIVNNYDKFVPDTDHKNMCGYSRAYRMAVRSNDADLLVALTPAQHWLSTEDKIIRAARIESALERVYNTFGPAELGPEKRIKFQDISVTLGTYLVLQAVPNCALENVSFLLQQADHHIGASFFNEQEDKILHEFRSERRYPTATTIQRIKDLLS